MNRRRILSTLLGGLTAEIVGKVVPLLVLRFAIARLGVERFGYAQFGYSLIDLTITLVVAGYAQTAAVELGRSHDNPSMIKSIVSEVTALKLINAVVGFGLIVLAFLLVPEYQKYAPVTLTLSWVLLTTALDMSYVHIGTRRMLSLSVLTIAVKLLSLTAVLVCVRTPDDLILFALLYFGANGLIGLGNFIINVRRFGWCRPTAIGLKQRFYGSAPFAFMVLLMMILERYDVFFIENLLGPTGAGLYLGTARIVQALANVAIAVSAVFFSEIVATESPESLTQHAYLGLWVLCALLMPVAAGAWLVGGDFIGLVLGPEFHGLGPVFAILVMALLAQAFVMVFGFQVLMVHRRAGTISAVLGASTVVGILLCILLRQSFGMNGVALANLGSRLVAAGLFLGLAAKYLTRWPWREILSTAGPALGMAAALRLLEPLLHLKLVENLVLGMGFYSAFFILMNRGKIVAALLALKSTQRPRPNGHSPDTF